MYQMGVYIRGAGDRLVVLRIIKDFAEHERRGSSTEGAGSGCGI